ncbi:MAG: membrane protein insertase YidC [Planctomycetota bacterium]
MNNRALLPQAAKIFTNIPSFSLKDDKLMNQRGSTLWRYVLFIAIGFAGVLLYIKFFAPPPPAKGEAGAADSRTAVNTPPSSLAARPATVFQAPAGKANHAEIKNDVLVIKASGRGARLLSVRLLGFKLEVNDPDSYKNDPEKCLELVYHSEAPVSAFSLILGGEQPYRDATHPLHALAGKLETSDWNITKIPADANGGEGIEWNLELAGFKFTKTFRLGKTGYLGAFSLQIAAADSALENSQNASATLQLNLLPAGWLFSDLDQFYQTPYAIAGSARAGRSVETATMLGQTIPGITNPANPVWSDLKQRAPDQMNEAKDRFTFVADSNRYFVAGMIPKSAETAEALITTRSLGIAASNHIGRMEPRAAAVAVLQSGLPKVSKPIVYEFITYFGPKEHAALAIAPEFREIERTDRSSFLTPGWLSDGIGGLLRLIQKFIGNWGLTIIVLTILLRIVIFPLTRRSQVTMAEFASKQAMIKPKMDELTKKYKDNPKKLNEERLKLFKQNNVPIAPPVLGCLPIFLNIPIFVGFFSALRTMYEMRHQPFGLWITDLSRPDEFITFSQPFNIPLFGSMIGEIRGLNILAILMIGMWIANQVVSMKVMPRPSDPQQATVQKFTMVLTIVMGSFLYNYASGLAIYSCTSSTVTLLEQTIIRKLWPPAKPVLPGSAAMSALSEVAKKT